MKNGSAGFLRRVTIALVLLCTATIVVAAVLHWHRQKQLAIDTAQSEARTLAERDVLNRYLSARYGGFFVPQETAAGITAASNPLVSADTTVRTDDNRTLVLVSHVEMTRLMYRLLNEHFGYRGHLTRLDTQRVDGMPDPWETAALQSFATGAEEATTVQTDDGVEYLRFIHVVRADESCRNCHETERYTPGAVFGGFSLSVPLAPFLAAQWSHYQGILLSYVLLWVAGMLLIWYAVGLLRDQFRAIHETETQRELVENSLHYLSHFDPTTNLPNRKSFDDRLGLALLHAERRDELVAVAVMQVSNFKQICNIFDHQVGDQLLRLMAERVSQGLWPDDIIARHDKESLLLLLPGLQARENVARIVNKINSALEAPVEIEGHEAFVRACFGVSLFPQDGRDASGLVNFAETAASRALAERNQSGLQMYSAELNVAAHEHLLLETGLHKALRDRQLQVFYQPQVDAPSGRIIGAEALLRWNHPEKGWIRPDLFIPLAENNGTIISIGEWVLASACQQAAEWHRRFGVPIRIGINVSGKQFQDNSIVDAIDRVLAETALPPEFLEVEVTEGVVMEEIDKAITALVDLKVRGVKVAIDDFGTGYSSLSQLKKLPFDRLKIDRSFIVDLTSDHDKQAIVEMIIELAARMNLEIIAEGVEHLDQVKFLVAHGCYQMQGFHFGRPMTASAFADLLGQGPPAR